MKKLLTATIFAFALFIPALAFAQTAPHISGVTSDANGITIKGERLDLTGNIILYNGKVPFVPRSTTATSVTMGVDRYIPAPADGRHYIQITNTTTGNSNIVYFTVSTTTATPAQSVAVTTTTSAFPGCTPGALFSTTTGRSCLVQPTTSAPTTNQPTEDDIENDCIDLKHNMSYRSRDARTNNEVSLLQDFLNDQGYLSSEATGYFGTLTRTAVRKFQSAGLFGAIEIPNGRVGAKERAKIKTITCGGVTTATSTAVSASGDPGIGSGSWIPSGMPNRVVADQSFGLTTFVPGCLNGGLANNGSHACALNTFYGNREHTIFFPTESMPGKTVLIRYKTKPTITNGKDIRVRSHDGDTVKVKMRVWLSTDPRSLYSNVSGSCKNTSNVMPVVNTGNVTDFNNSYEFLGKIVDNWVQYCKLEPNTVYYFAMEHDGVGVGPNLDGNKLDTSLNRFQVSTLNSDLVAR